MFKRKKTTLSFEGNEIRFLIVKGEKVLSWATRKFPLEQMSQGLVRNTNTIGEVIQSTLKEIKAPRKNVVTSITGRRSVHRIMRIPNIQEKLLEETIHRKAKQEFAIPLEETDLSWRIINKNNTQIILYVLAVPNLIIDNQVEILRAAKIKSKVMDIKPLALQRFINQNTSIIVNLESYSMGVIIVVNHIPILVRTIPLDPGNLTDEAKVDLLSQELARTSKFYNESNKNNRLPEDTIVYLTGKLFDIPQIDSRLEEGPNLVERLQSRTSFTVKLPKPSLEIPEHFPIARFAVNLGLALKKSK